MQRPCGRRQSGKYEKLKEDYHGRSRENKESLLEGEVGEVDRVHTRWGLVVRFQKFRLY